MRRRRRLGNGVDVSEHEHVSDVSIIDNGDDNVICTATGNVGMERFRESLATAETLASSALSHDHCPQPQHQQGNSDHDQVSSLNEVSRGIFQRQHNYDGIEEGEGQQEDGGCECSCQCKSCMSVRGIATIEFRPDPLVLPNSNRRWNRRASLSDVSLTGLRRRRSHYSNDDLLHHSRISSFVSEEENYISETELKFKGEESFDEHIISVATRDLPDSLNLLRRTRAISALSNRLMAAPDEAACNEEVVRLLTLMFGVERVSFGMLTGSDHFLLKRVNVVKKNQNDLSSFELEVLESDYKRPLEGTAAGICARTLKEHYTPRTRDSNFATHKVFYRNGMNTVLISPILVNGGKCAGCIMLARDEEDGFKKPDRVLISDIGLLLGANIYAKRLLRAAEESKKRSREMLHSFIPPKVLAKIECYWDENSEEHKSRRDSVSGHTSPDSSQVSNTSDHRSSIVRSNSWYVEQSDWTEDEIGKAIQSNKRSDIKSKIQMIKNMNHLEDDTSHANHLLVSTSEMEFTPTTRALYAESVTNVCIVFTDIVGFSRIAMKITPTAVMDMLQDLFSRFDELCDVHGVMKLETIGDAYICATNLMEEEDDDGEQDAAIRALAMAKDMVIEATNVGIPSSDAKAPFETLQIRVGIHVGDVTCGVLGQRLPKFTTCGTAVNMAARMEQTSHPGRIRVTKAFHDLVGDAESGWMEKEVIPLKNMGQMETYLLNPTESRMSEGPDIII
ncbi:hypothetical protein ACHAXR_005224 [Thalassiosira sp. AJA248-18]